MKFNRLINDLISETETEKKPEPLEGICCKCNDCIHWGEGNKCLAKEIKLSWSDGPGSTCECQTYSVKDKEHDCATHVHHESFGDGECVHAEHAEPDGNGYVSWYTVMFEHGTEVINTKDVTILKETHHGHSKKKKM